MFAFNFNPYNENFLIESFYLRVRLSAIAISKLIWPF